MYRFIQTVLTVKKLRWYFLVSLCLLAVSILMEAYFNRLNFGERDIEKFNRVLITKQNELEKGMDQIEENLSLINDSLTLFEVLPENYYSEYQDNGLAYFFYRDSTLEFWSDNIIPVPENKADLPEQKLIHYGNSEYMSATRSVDSGIVYGLILLKTEHPYANRMLFNGFLKEFGLPDDVEIRLSGDKDTQIFDREGNPVFNLDFRKAEKKPAWLKVIIIFLYGLTLFSLILLFRRVIHHVKRNSQNLCVILSGIFLILIYQLCLYFQVPRIVLQLDIFTVLTIQNPVFSPTIGDLFMIVLIGFFLIYSIYVDFRLPEKKLDRSGYQVFIIIVFSLFSLLIYLINNAILKFLILNTEISFETFKVLDLSAFTFMAFTILAIIFASFAIWTDKLLSVFEFTGNIRAARIYLISVILGILILFVFPGIGFISLESTLFFIVVCLALYYFRFISKFQYRFSSFIFYVLMFSIFTVIEVTRYTDEKNNSQMKMMAVSLSSEHDPVAELLFVDLEKNIETDEEIQNMLYADDFDFTLLYNTVQRKYFRGFWDKYDLQITLCGQKDSVHVSPPVDDWYPCYPFFYDTILSEGVMVPNTDVYFLDNLNGRISYFLALVYNPGTEDEVTMFIELDSRLVLEGLGYPSLLLDESMQPATREYSYAKYNHNRLITSAGEFDYSTRSDVYSKLTEGFEEFRYDGYDHVAYHIDRNNVIIVSKPSLFWVDALMSFSYIFSFYFLVVFTLLLLSRISPISFSLKPTFKTRIQIGMNSVLFFSFIFIGAGTVYFSINQYRTKQYEILEEKVQSVYIELIHKLEFESDLSNWSSEDYFNLDELLEKFSNVFYTDINLFDGNGILLASSRPEIFRMGLLGNRMDANAYREMSIQKRSEYVQREVIGKLKYLSVYVPFVNADNQLLAYLNLPYFTRQDALTREITNLVVAIINIVVLLSLLSFTIAVFMANTITMPLNLIQQKLARFSLSEKNEIIGYKRNDEIGNLVKEYNQMVDQLQKSAELLAKSERESAWREMAKQIAHEIKNPLTPMKLNIQHLQRTLHENPENAAKQIEKIATTLIEQIENLSSIATEFSNFAKMPQARNEVLDLEKELKKSIELFTDYENCILSLKVESSDKLEVFVDREQISRVFINLIKNAIQSVPENRIGKIEVRLGRNEEKAVIRFKDNGKGIPEEVRGKLFTPNFTTKTSGMGLGLAIVRNIVHNAGGEIYFETELDKGTTFYVELPLVNK